MAATFRDGLEAAARLVESEIGDCHEIEARARAIRAIEEPAEPLDAIEDDFRQFQTIYLGVGGFRNPKSINAVGWDEARKVFEWLIRKKKHHPSAIVSGTAAYAATRHDSKFVKAPAAFLRAEWFTWDWSQRDGRPPTGNKNGATSLFDVEHRLSGNR